MDSFGFTKVGGCMTPSFCELSKRDGFDTFVGKLLEWFIDCVCLVTNIPPKRLKPSTKQRSFGQVRTCGSCPEARGDSRCDS